MPGPCSAALLDGGQLYPQEHRTLWGKIKPVLWQLLRQEQFSYRSMNLVSVCGQWSSSEQTGSPSDFVGSLSVCTGCERELRSQLVLHKVT